MFNVDNKNKNYWKKPVHLKKRMLFGFAILAIIIVTIFFIQNRDAMHISKQNIYKEVNNKYSDLLKTIGRLLEYKTGDIFYFADINEPDNGVDIKGEIKEGDLCVKHGIDLEYYTLESIDEEFINIALKIDGISMIKISKKAIIFVGDDLVDKIENGFCGFYYSLNGKPQGVQIFEYESLKKDEKGWSGVNNEELSWYYTEKIKGKFYYYEGVFYP